MEWMDEWLASCWSSSSSEEEAFQETTLKFHLASPQTTVAATATDTTATLPMTLCSRTRRRTTITTADNGCCYSVVPFNSCMALGCGTTTMRMKMVLMKTTKMMIMTMLMRHGVELIPFTLLLLLLLFIICIVAFSVIIF